MQAESSMITKTFELTDEFSGQTNSFTIQAQYLPDSREINMSHAILSICANGTPLFTQVSASTTAICSTSMWSERCMSIWACSLSPRWFSSNMNFSSTAPSRFATGTYRGRRGRARGPWLRARPNQKGRWRKELSAKLWIMSITGESYTRRLTKEAREFILLKARQMWWVYAKKHLMTTTTSWGRPNTTVLTSKCTGRTR